ncbi:hypothetical protein COB64_04190 [Candidatus Wolfebacteria bacterium]|nr:MAG: hypothetical protein COB64_04190 [Candidatus Wolfebacteria bacterium]
MSIKSFFLKKMLKLQLKKNNVPQDQQDKIIDVLTSNPELFQKIAKEAEEKVKQGFDQQKAMMEVMKKYQHELKGIL